MVLCQNLSKIEQLIINLNDELKKKNELESERIMKSLDEKFENQNNFIKHLQKSNNSIENKLITIEPEFISLLQNMNHHSLNT